MSTENDVPLGDGARRYYEQLFGDRIRRVNKGSDSAPQGNDGGGSNWNGRAGCGGAVAAFIIIRILIALAHSSWSTPSHDYSTPPAHFRLQPQFEERNVPLNERDDLEVRRHLDQLLLDLERAEKQADPAKR